MVFTVDLPAGMRDFELAAYMRMLARDGVNIAHTPRIRDPRTGSRWLHVWADRADAEGFASRLQEEAEEPAWQVYDLPDDERSTGALGPLEIAVKRQSDGYTYGMRPTTYNLLRKRFPQSRTVDSVFIATDTRGNDEAGQSSDWDRAAQILTGLNEEQMHEFGGYVIYDTAGHLLREAAAFWH